MYQIGVERRRIACEQFVDALLDVGLPPPPRSVKGQRVLPVASLNGV